MAQDRSYIEMREMLKRMRNKGEAVWGKQTHKPTRTSKKIKDISTKEMIKRMNENFRGGYGFALREEGERQITPVEFEQEKEKFRNVFQNDEVEVVFNDLLVMNGGVFWSGTVDNQIQWAFSVTPNENSSGLEMNYLQGFDPQEPENDQVIKNLEAYYKEFYQYWRNNELDNQS